MSKAKIKKGDTVVVIAGDDKGKSGKVLEVAPEAGRVLVEGINTVKKHMRKSEDNPQGGIVEREAFMAISNVKLSA
jgi:large subunit ribosomal protein L24